MGKRPSIEKQLTPLGKSAASGTAPDGLARASVDLTSSPSVTLGVCLNNISQGLCVFNGEQRLVFCNDLFAAMYNLSTEQVRPGITLDELVDLREAAGTCTKLSRREYLGWRNTGSDAHHLVVVELKDGRFVRINHKPMPDGGWIATHEDVTASKRDEARIAHMARHDALTELANRTAFAEHLRLADRELQSRGKRFAVLMLDLDGFKKINDCFGHTEGDTLLREVACRLQQVVDKEDVIARLGGDEFAIQSPLLQPDEPNDPFAAAAGLAARILDALGKPFRLSGRTVSIGASIGIALAPDHGRSPEELLKRADKALYRSKSLGRNRFSLYDSSIMPSPGGLPDLETDMRIGLEQGAFEVYYQPIVCVTTRRMVAMEALLRWQHPQLGMIPPDEFIPTAEETGLIHALGEYVLLEACKDARAWPSYVKVAVNLSALQFQNADLVQQVARGLAVTGLEPQRLELEITESVLLQRLETNVAMLMELRDLGVSIALDDFGTGYSSLSYLRMFAFDKIKIDRSFVREMPNLDACAAIVCAVANLGRSLRITTTAEGVETEEQFNLLRAAGCTQAQGYLFGRPKPLAEFSLDESEFQNDLPIERKDELTAADIMLVRASFSLVVPIQDRVVDEFYDRLFVIAPDLRALFPENLDRQKQKLMAMMTQCVGKLDDLSSLASSAKALGARHVGYGVLTEHYAIARQALLWALQQGLGWQFTVEVRSAWTRMYEALTGAMLLGAAEAASTRAA